MTRMYIQPSFLDSCSDHGEWSGGNDQYRGDRSVDFSTFDKNGRARVEAFSDAALEANKAKRKTSVSLKDRILPQARRVSVLTEQLRELEVSYKSGEFDIHEYSVLRDVLSAKRDRAMILYKKAISVRPKSAETDEDSAEYTYETFSTSSDNNGHGESYSSPVGVEFIDTLSDGNSLKGLLKMSCKFVRGLVRFSSATKRYIKTLSEV